MSEHVSQFPGQAVQELKVDEDEVEVKVYRGIHEVQAVDPVVVE